MNRRNIVEVEFEIKKSTTIGPNIPFQMSSSRSQRREISHNTSKSANMEGDSTFVPPNYKLVGDDNYNIWSFILEQIFRRENLQKYVIRAPSPISK